MKAIIPVHAHVGGGIAVNDVVRGDKVLPRDLCPGPPGAVIMAYEPVHVLAVRVGKIQLTAGATGALSSVHTVWSSLGT